MGHVALQVGHVSLSRPARYCLDIRLGVKAGSKHAAELDDQVSRIFSIDPLA